MAINTAKVLESNLVLSEFTADPATPAPVPLTRASARVLSDRWVKTGPAVTAKRRVRVDWYLLAVILLILTYAAVCIYRLAWAMKP